MKKNFWNTAYKMTKNMQKDIVEYAENKYCKSLRPNIANHFDQILQINPAHIVFYGYVPHCAGHIKLAQISFILLYKEDDLYLGLDLIIRLIKS